MDRATVIPKDYWSTARYGYFRDHGSMSWGVVRGLGGCHMARPDGGDGIIVTGLDKSVAAAVACLLNGDIAYGRLYLDHLPEKLP